MGKMSRHNLKYWEMQTVAALGPSATGFLAEKSLRYKWRPEMLITKAGYELEKLSPKFSKIRTVLLLLCELPGGLT